MSPTHPLAQLMDSVKEANGWSDIELARIARRKGHALTKSNVSRYRNENPLISIKGEIIRALAAALGVSVHQVATAAVQSMGIALPVYDAPSAEQAIRVDPDLSVRDKDMLLSMLGQMRGPHEKGQPHDFTTQPTTTGSEGKAPEGEKNRDGGSPSEPLDDVQAASLELADRVDDGAAALEEDRQRK